MMTNAVEIQPVGGELVERADGRTSGDGTVGFLIVLGGAFVVVRFLAAFWRASKVRGRFSENPGE